MTGADQAGAGAGPSVARMPVVHVTWSLTAGGSERFALLAASYVAPNRFCHSVIALDKGGPLEGQLSARGIPYRIMARRQDGIDWALFRRIWREFRQMRPAVVHTHHFNELFYAGVLARLSGARLIHTEHSIAFLDHKKYRVALRVLSALCDLVTVVGEDGYRALLRRARVPATKLEVLRAGVDVDAFQYSRATARAEMGIAEDSRVAVIVARIFPEKNHLMLLDSFASVVHRVPNALLLIVGDGTEEDAVKTRVRELSLDDHVRLLGVRSDIPRVLAASDVFVLSSDREALPIAILEAMAAGLPVVSTAVGDIPGVVQDGVSGRLVPPGDAESMAAAMGSCLADPVAAREMGARGRDIVVRDYGIAAMAARLERLYLGATANTGRN